MRPNNSGEGKSEKWIYLMLGCVFVVLFGFVMATQGTPSEAGWGGFIVAAGVGGIIYSLLKYSDEMNKGG